jgi:hypothetical protein
MCLPFFMTQALGDDLRRRIRNAPREDSNDELFDSVDGQAFSDARRPRIRNPSAEDADDGTSLREVREKVRPAELLPRVVYDVLSAKDLVTRELFDKYVKGKTQEELDAKYTISRGKKKK